MALKDIWKDLVDGVSEIDVDDINNIAGAVINIENEGVSTDLSNYYTKQEVEQKIAEVSNIALNSKTVADNAIEIAQSVRAEIDEFGGFWGLDLPLIKTITLEESVTSIDILSKAEGIGLQEFTVLLFIKYLGDAIESNSISNCTMCLRTNSGVSYFGYKSNYSFYKNSNSFAFWHTKIYNKQFALTDLYSGYGNTKSDIPYKGFQGLDGSTPTQYSSYTSYSGDAVDNLNIFIKSNDVSRGAIIPQGSMIFLFGR